MVSFRGKLSTANGMNKKNSKRMAYDSQEHNGSVASRALRHRLLEDLEASHSPSALAAIQRRLAAEIMASEREQTHDRAGALEGKFHRRQLRLMGDSIAWRVLHPHAIRNLAKNAGKPPKIIDRSAEIEKCLLAVEEVAGSFKVEGLVADLTHCVKIGDVILARDRERPDIIEFKSKEHKPEHQHQGRRGRQLYRMKKTAEYLNTGKVDFGEEAPTRWCLPVSVPATFNFDAVERVTAKALDSGSALEVVETGHWIGSCRPGSTPVFPENHQFHGGTWIAFLSDAIPNLLSEVAPPMAWPISFDARCALMEGELTLFQIVDSALFLRDGVRFTQDDVPTETMFDVQSPAGWFKCSAYFARQVLFGFRTIDSIVKTMIAATRQASDLGVVPQPPENEVDPAHGTASA